MIDAKRLAEIRRDAIRIAGLDTRHIDEGELLELVTVYEATQKALLAESVDEVAAHLAWGDVYALFPEQEKPHG